VSGGTNTIQFENNCFTETCSGSEAGSYVRLIDFAYHSTLGLSVIKKKKDQHAGERIQVLGCPRGRSNLKYSKGFRLLLKPRP